MRSTMETIVLATRNPGKIQEISAILADLPIRIVPVSAFPEVKEVVEDGRTIEENALKKARIISAATHLPALADDTGLEVLHLGLRPGVISARYAGENATYAENNQKLLGELGSIPMNRRGARFRCIAVFTDGDEETLTEGICHGHIALAPRGIGGFGYDPLFVPDGYSDTLAELSPAVKNAMSHRAKAFQRMRMFLRSRLRLV
jgi:XTP/dITP diphosphohydrolase